MSLTMLILALLAITPIAIFALRAVDRRIRRHRQLVYVTGPLRDQVAWMAEEDADGLDACPLVWRNPPLRHSAVRRVVPR